MFWRCELFTPSNALVRGEKASTRDLHFLCLAVIYGNKRQERSGAPEHSGGLFPGEASTRRGVSSSVLPAATASLPPAVGSGSPAVPATPGHGRQKQLSSNPTQTKALPCSLHAWLSFQALPSFPHGHRACC